MDNFCNGTAFVRIMLYMIVSMFCISMRRSGEKDLQKRIAVIEFQCITFYALHFILQFIQWSLYFVIYITQLLLIIIYIKDHFSFTSPHLSSLCLMAHKAFTESLHLSRLAATVFACSHDCHSASALSFSTVRVQVAFGLPLLLFSSGAQVIAMLQLLFWSCLSICSIILHLRCFTSLLIGFMSALSSSSSVLTFFIGADVGTGGVL